MSTNQVATADDGVGVGGGADEKTASVSSSPKRPEKEVASKKKQRQFRSRKPKDMPRRPLSAYNIFFKEERAKLLADCQAQGPAAGEKIGFERMAKTIGKRWKELTEQELGRFKLLAKDDTERYRREMDAYNYDLAMKGRKEREESSRRRLEEAGTKPQAGTPSSFPAASVSGSLHQIATAEPSSKMGKFAGSHLLNRQVTGTHVANNPHQQSVSAQLNRVLAGAQLPTLQGLRGLLGNAPSRLSPLHDLLGKLGQQQNEARLEEQFRQQQQRNQAQSRLKDELRQQQQTQAQSRLEDQLRQRQRAQAQARLEERFRQQQKQAELEDQLRQQQSQARLENQLRQQENQTQATLEDQLRQQSEAQVRLENHFRHQQNQARLEGQLQTLLNQKRANPASQDFLSCLPATRANASGQDMLASPPSTASQDFLSSLPASLQQRLLVHSLQSGNNSVFSDALNSLASSSGPSP